MAYGILKCDTITFTDGGIDKSVSISGLVQNPTFSGNITVTGTISGNTLQGQTVSGVTVTGTTAQFTSGTFTSITGTTLQGTTATYTTGSFTSLTGTTTQGTTTSFTTGTFTSLTGTTTTGTTATFATGVFSSSISGAVITATSGVIASGTAANPSLSIVGDPNTGIYSPGADQVAISTNGTGRVFVDASGQVGVGISPSYTLDVAGSTSTARLGKLQILNDAPFITGANIDSGLNSIALGSSGNAPALFFTNNTERLRITSTGELKHLGGQAESSPAVYFAGSAPSNSLYVQATTGRVGLGTSAPADALHLASGNFRLTNGAAFATGNSDIASIKSFAGAANQFETARIAFRTGAFVNRGEIAFSTGDDTSLSEKVRIDYLGRVGIGITDPTVNLHVSSSGNTKIRIADTGTAPTSFGQTNGGLELVGGNANTSAKYMPAIKFGSTDSAFTTTTPKFGAAITAEASEAYDADTDGGMSLAFWTTSNDPGTGGNLQQRLTILNSGNVGIGSTSPSQLLTLSSSNANDGIRIQNTTGASGSRSRIGFQANNSYDGNSVNAAIDAILENSVSTATHLAFSTAPNSNLASASLTERARIDSSGRLLVGTTSTGSSRNIYGGLEFEQPQSGNNAWAHFTQYGNSYTNRGARLYLNFTLGTSTGSATAVTTEDELGAIHFRGANGTTFQSAAEIKGETDTGTISGTSMPGRLVFSTTADGASSPTERMRIRSDGSVAINGSGSNVVSLWVLADTDDSTAFAFALYNASSQDLFYVRNDGYINTGTRTVSPYNNTTASAANMYVFSDGGLYRSTSSIRFKTDIETLQPQYADALLNCRPVWYRSLCTNDNKDWGYWGFIAEEVAEIDPRLVFWKTHETEKDEDGNTVQVELEEPIAEGVQYDRFVPHLLNLIKRQKEQIEAQGTAIAALEARLSALEAQ